MDERRRGFEEDGNEQDRDEEGKNRQERDASREAVEEEEQSGGPRTQGDG